MLKSTSLKSKIATSSKIVTATLTVAAVFA